MLNKKSFWMGVCALQFVIIAGLFSWIITKKMGKSADSKKSFEYPTITVEARPVVMGTFENFIYAIGTLRANDSIVVKSQDGGVVQDIFFKGGEKVEKGDTILKLRDETLLAQKREVMARSNLSQKRYEMYKMLYEKKAAPKTKVDEEEAEYKVSLARIEGFDEKIQNTYLKAPFSGVISLKDVSVGAYVKPGEEIVSLDSLDPIFLDFRVSETLLDKVKVGDKVSVEIDGFPDYSYEAQIDAVNSIIDEKDHSVRVRASMANSSLDLKPGLFARVKIVEGLSENSLLIPESALETEGNQEYVFAVIDGVAYKAPVKTGKRNGSVVEIKSGLQAGIMVVTSGQMRLSDGFPVIVVPEKPKSGYR